MAALHYTMEYEKQLKEKGIPQIKIRQIVKFNDKIMINSNIPYIRDKKMISKHPRLTFFGMSGCVKDCVVIDCNIAGINNFLCEQLRVW